MPLSTVQSKPRSHTKYRGATLCRAGTTGKILTWNRCARLASGARSSSALTHHQFQRPRKRAFQTKRATSHTLTHTHTHPSRAPQPAAHTLPVPSAPATSASFRLVRRVSAQAVPSSGLLAPTLGPPAIEHFSASAGTPQKPLLARSQPGTVPYGTHQAHGSVLSREAEF